MPLKWTPHFPFNSIFLLRACTWLIQSHFDQVSKFIHETIKAFWESGLDVTDAEKVEAFIGSNSEPVKLALKEAGALAD